MKYIMALLCLVFPHLSIAVPAHTLVVTQYNDAEVQQNRLIYKPSENSFLYYTESSNVINWSPMSSVTMSSSQISDSSAVGRSLMSAEDQQAARSAIGAGTSNFSGSYASLTGAPTNLNQFTNGPGFITATSAPVTSVNGLTGGVSLNAALIGAATASHTHTASQITDSTTIGRQLITAANQAAVQAIVGSTSQVNSDWLSSSGVSQILNKPAKYTGSTNGSGIYSVTYGSAYSSKPHLVFSVEGGTNKDTAVLTSTTTTGFSIIVERRSDVIGLLPTYSPVSGLVVNVTVTP